MNSHRLLVAAVAPATSMLVPPIPATAQVIDVAWGAAGDFERNLSVPPGKFVELCAALKPGQAVQWRFEARQALDFNIHFHEGKEVRYPERADQVRALQGTLRVELVQDYCWMWTNNAAAAAGLQVKLEMR